MVPKRPFHNAGVSRRNLLISAGTFLAGGGVVAAAGSQPAAGSVSTTSLSIPPATYQGTDGSVADLRLAVSGNYEYKAPNAEMVRLSLEVAPEDTANPDYQSIDQTEQSLAADSGAGQFSLSGSILAHPAMDTAMFSAEPEQTKSHHLPVRVLMDVLSGGQTVISAMSTTVAEVTVENTSIAAEAAVIGEGQIAIEV